VEIVNSDLQPLINSLGNIEKILEPLPSALNNLGNQGTIEDQEPLEEPTDNLEQDTGFIPPTLETDDLDLLLYENPNLFK